METFADAVEQLTSAQAGGFDLNDAQAARLTQEAVKRLAAESHWIKAELELGPTVAEEPSYGLPDKVVRLFDVAIGTKPFDRIDIRKLWDLRSGRSTLTSDERGAFAERFSADGLTKTFDIFPTPEEVGQAILGLASIVPDDLSDSSPLPFPAQYRRAIPDYAKGIAYEDIDENPAQAEHFLTRANATAEGLFLLGNSRTGSGPYRIPVAGHRRR